MIPKPYYSNKNQIKAFVLGCDPTAFDAKRNRLEFDYVFGICEDRRYFASILKNLEAVGLGIDCIYVQNLVPGYQEIETSENKNWPAIAAREIPFRRQEFDAIDPSGKLPVFLTSRHLYQALINENIQLKTPTTIYAEAAPIKPEDNKLGRMLVVLYRHYRYSVKKKQNYFIQMKNIFDFQNL